MRDQLIEGIKRLRIGHLLALLHFGSMPHHLCLKNIDLHEVVVGQRVWGIDLSSLTSSAAHSRASCIFPASRNTRAFAKA